ncbi:MAG: ParA family protein [Cruoricaptor ignavus]|nr:ParA family protein [Cruoricaptor ignavus]
MSKIILITHQKGGVGKSTLTFNMALALHNDAKVAIIDLDLQGSLYKSRNNSEILVFPPSELNNIQNLDFDFIFIDTPPYLTNELPKLCKMANAIVIPTKTGIYDLLAIEETIKIINQLGKENITKIVFNMVKPNTSLTSEMKEALDNYNISVADTFISDLVAFTRSPINNNLADEKAKLQMENLTMEILKLTHNI